MPADYAWNPFDCSTNGPNWRQTDAVSLTLEIDGLSVSAGASADFDRYSTLQAAVMPVISLQESQLQCWGTAVCVGTDGWFLSAGHVVDDFIEAYGQRDDGSTGLFLMWESDETTGTGENDYLGALLPVANYHRHPAADLVALTTKVPPAARGRLRVVSLALRMPQIGEPVAVVGYRHMQMVGSVVPPQRSVIDYERILTVGLGAVLEQQPDRRWSGVRGSPGVVTDAPIFRGMSGGPAFDANREVIGFASSSMKPKGVEERWNSYVALCGPALELTFMVSDPGKDKASVTSLAELVAADAVFSSADDTFDADAHGKATYRI